MAETIDEAKQENKANLFGCPNWWPGLILVVAIVIAYKPVWHGGFLWDDAAHLTYPHLRSLSGLGRIWTEPGTTQQYYPLTHSVFWLEYKMWGDSTTGYHWVNIVLHACSALLVVKILRQLKVCGAWLAAACFALHPIQVESVAWISELKNTLSGVLYLGALLAWLNFDLTRRNSNYIAALGLYLLALMSKTVVASLPGALLVIVWWQRGSISFKRDVLPLIPFFAAGIAAGLFTAWVERTYLGANGSDYQFTIVERFLIAGRDVWFYLGKLVWPADLAFMYGRWNISQTSWWQYLFPGAVVMMLAVLILRRWRGALAAMLFFCGTLFPALGFFNVFPFRFSLVADHFQYLAGLGPMTLVAAGLSRNPLLSLHLKPVMARMAGVLLVLMLGGLTWSHSKMYSSEESLWRDTVQMSPDSWMAQFSYGKLLLEAGQADAATLHLLEAVRLKPDVPNAWNDLGKAYALQGKLDEALAMFTRAVTLNPRSSEAHYNLGHACLLEGKTAEARAQLSEALQLKPSDVEVKRDLARALLSSGRAAEAIPYLTAVAAAEPNDARSRFGLGLACLAAKRIEAALTNFQNAQRLAPDNSQYMNTLAWIYATCPRAELRNGAKAVLLASKVCELDHRQNPKTLDTLAAAYAETGRFDEAIQIMEQITAAAASAHDAETVALACKRLKLYKAGKPFRDDSL